MQAEKELNKAALERGRPRPGGRTLFDQAYLELKTQILENRLPAGYQATEQELSQLLGMSRTPVREATIRLANERLIEIRPRHGMRVLPISVDDMVEIYQVLTALESAAAAEVAEMGLGESEIARMEKAVTDMESALTRNDLRAWARADERFHQMLVEFSGNSRLIEMVQTLFDQSHRVRLLTLKMRPKPTESNRDHADLVKAIKTREPERARKIHWDHREKNGRMLVDILRKSGFNQL